MTVAAIILAATTASALADADGQPGVRRIVDVAWAGGAVPLIVVAPDPDGAVATALVGAPATLVQPSESESGVVAAITRGIEAARTEITGTDAALIWPAQMTWVDPETVTSLLEAHGVDQATLLRPSFGGEAGWPVLLPLEHVDAFRSLAPDGSPEDLVADAIAGGLPSRAVDVGDPGAAIDASTPRRDLPPYAGPPQPAGGHVHEWGAASVGGLDDVPLEGPGLAPYGQAAAEDPDQPG